ncbi:MAG: 3-hydroxyacyl-ACP dehydratase FabZ [Mailhella sp.]|nr:3-hydroxyacyl-ACP dehydratase FabZ [Mailhella sp.]
MPDVLKTEDILRILPHRYPFVLLDRVEEYHLGEYIRAYKNLTYNEAFFQGHFPGMPVMPGVLIIEAMAQAGALLIGMSEESFKSDPNVICLITGIEKARFRHPVLPGDKLVLECTDFRHRFKLWKMQAKASVDGTTVAEAELTAAVNYRGGLR